MSIRMGFEAQKTLAAASVGASYTAVGTATVNPARQFLVQNLTDASLQFSFDGATDHFPLLPNASWDSDNNTNRANNEDQNVLAANTTLYVKRIGTPTTGSVYFSIVY